LGTRREAATGPRGAAVPRWPGLRGASDDRATKLAMPARTFERPDDDSSPGRHRTRCGPRPFRCPWRPPSSFSCRLPSSRWRRCLAARECCVVSVDWRLPLAEGGAVGGGRIGKPSGREASRRSWTVGGRWRPVPSPGVLPGTSRFDGAMRDATRQIGSVLSDARPDRRRWIVDARDCSETGALILPAVGLILAAVVCCATPGVWRSRLERHCSPRVAVLGVFDALAGFLSVTVRRGRSRHLQVTLATATEMRNDGWGLAVDLVRGSTHCGLPRGRLRRAAAQSAADWREWNRRPRHPPRSSEAWAIQKMITALPGLGRHAAADRGARNTGRAGRARRLRAPDRCRSGWR